MDQATKNTLVCLSCDQLHGTYCLASQGGNQNIGDLTTAHDCPLARFPSRGLGDTVDKITTATGIKSLVKAVMPDCGCDKRRSALNNVFPYPKEP